jgi:hypothetical protein
MNPKVAAVLGLESSTYSKRVGQMGNGCSLIDDNLAEPIITSTIINLFRVREVQPWFHGNHIVLLQNGEKLRISRYQREAVQRLLGRKQ